MAYEAQVVQVVIASPGDVAAERDSARIVIHDWTVINAKDRRVALLPLAWETWAAPASGQAPTG